MMTVEQQKEKLKELTDRFDSEGIRYVQKEVNDKIVFVYVIEKEYDITKRKKKSDFIPEFRISTHDDDPIGCYYVKDCGYTHYMNQAKIIEYFKN